MIQLGAGAGLVAAVLATGIATWQHGLRDVRLTDAGRQLFAAVASAVLQGLLPTDPAERQRALLAHLNRLDTTIAGLPPAMQAEVAELIGLLATRPTRWLLTGQFADWADAEPAEVAATLHRLQLSALSARQQVFHALRDLTNAAYFADGASWPAIGYPGPRSLQTTVS